MYYELNVKTQVLYCSSSFPCSVKTTELYRPETVSQLLYMFLPDEKKMHSVVLKVGTVISQHEPPLAFPCLYTELDIFTWLSMTRSSGWEQQSISIGVSFSMEFLLPVGLVAVVLHSDNFCLLDTSVLPSSLLCRMHGVV